MTIDEIKASDPTISTLFDKMVGSVNWDVNTLILKAYELGKNSNVMFSQKAFELIKHFESLHDGDKTMVGLQPKMDPIGVWTEGYGRAMIDPATGSFLKGANNKARAYQLATIRTIEEAEAGLREDIAAREKIARVKLKSEYWDRLNVDQKGALTSFVYNCGTGNPEYKIFNNIRLYLDNKWNVTQLRAYWDASVVRGGGKVLPGLQRRRRSEAELFLTSRLNFFQ